MKYIYVLKSLGQPDIMKEESYHTHINNVGGYLRKKWGRKFTWVASTNEGHLWRDSNTGKFAFHGYYSEIDPEISI